MCHPDGKRRQTRWRILTLIDGDSHIVGVKCLLKRLAIFREIGQIAVEVEIIGARAGGVCRASHAAMRVIAIGGCPVRQVGQTNVLPGITQWKETSL